MTNRRKRIFNVVVFTAPLAMVLLVGVAQATNLHAILEGSQEVPPVATPGSGDATFVLDDVTNELDYQINYQDLTSTTTASHLHRAPAGTNGPVVYTLAGPGFPSGHQGTVQVDPSDVPLLLNQGFYCNVHTQTYPAGEIRGQVRVTGTPVAPSTWGKIKDLYN